MAADLYQLARDELKSGESLIWYGSCLSQLGKQGRVADPMAGLILGGFFGLFSGVVISDLIGLNVPVLVLLTAPLGALLGFRFMPLSKVYRKSRTVYVLTDRRVFVLRDLRDKREVKSLPLQFITGIKLNGRDPIRAGPVATIPAMDRGTVTFSTALPRHPGFNDPYLRFFMTGDAQRVAGMATEAREKVIAGNA